MASSYLEVKATNAKSWEEEQLKSLNKVVKNLQNEIQLIKKSEATTKKKLNAANGKNKQVQENIRRLNGEKESLIQENLLLNSKVLTLEKEVILAHHSTFNDNNVSRIAEESLEDSIDEQLEESIIKSDFNEQNKTVDEKDKDCEALEMLEEIKNKLDMLNKENSLLSTELTEIKEEKEKTETGLLSIQEMVDIQLGSDEEACESLIERILQNVKNLKETASRAESERNKAQTESLEKNQKIEDLENEIENKNKLCKDFEDQKEQNQKLQNEFQELQMNYTVTLEKIMDLKINSSELSKQLENQKNINLVESEEKQKRLEEIEQYQTEIEKIQINLETFKKKKEDVEIENKKLKDQLLQVKFELEDTQAQLNSTLTTDSDLESQLKKSLAHNHLLEKENKNLKDCCKKLEQKVEDQMVAVENEKDALKVTMKSVEEVLFDKQNEMKEMKDAVSDVSLNNQKLLQQVNNYRQSINQLENEKDQMQNTIKELKRTCSLKTEQLKREKNEIVEELELRLEVTQRANEEILRNEQDLKEQLQNSYVRKLLKAEDQLKKKDKALELAEMKLKQQKEDFNFEEDAIDELEFKLELTRETNNETLRQEREIRDEIQASYIEKLMLTEEILQQKEEMLEIVEENLEKVQLVNKKLVKDNIRAVEKIKELSQSRYGISKFDHFNYQSLHKTRFTDKFISNDEYINLLQKANKLEEHLNLCIENNFTDNLKDYHSCRMENIQLEYDNNCLKQLFEKLQSSKMLSSQEFSAFNECLLKEERNNRLREKIAELKQEFSLLQYEEIEEMRKDCKELNKLNKIYEEELLSIAKHYNIPMMMLPLYNHRQNDEENLESTRAE